MREVVKDAARAFSRNGGRLLGGSVAFYTLLSIAPILVIALHVAGSVTDREATRAALLADVARWTGADGARTLGEILERADEAARVPSALTAILLLYASTRLFSQLKRALNQMWGIPNPVTEGIRGKVSEQLRKRALALAFVVLVGCVLLALVALKTALMAVARVLDVPGAWHGAEAALSLGVATCLFAAIFKGLPDARITLRDALTGGAVTAALFTVGTYALGAYLGYKHAGAAFGSAGSLVMLLLWVHYSAQIFFLGAAFTAAHARRRGGGLAPTGGAPDPAPDRAPDRALDGGGD
jgi:membrane protein